MKYEVTVVDDLCDDNWVENGIKFYFSDMGSLKAFIRTCLDQDKIILICKFPDEGEDDE